MPWTLSSPAPEFTPLRRLAQAAARRADRKCVRNDHYRWAVRRCGRRPVSQLQHTAKGMDRHGEFTRRPSSIRERRSSMAWSRVHRLRQTKSGQRRKRFLIEHFKRLPSLSVAPVPLLGRSAALYNSTKVARLRSGASRHRRSREGRQWRPAARIATPNLFALHHSYHAFTIACPNCKCRAGCSANLHSACLTAVAAWFICRAAWRSGAAPRPPLSPKPRTLPCGAGR